jgi:tetrathionate reductase subunit B
MGKVMLIRTEYCYGCGNCFIACKAEHWDNDYSPISAPEPDSGSNWMRLDYKLRGTSPKLKHAWTPIPCMQCDNPPCMTAAQGGAITKRPDGIVIIDPTKSVGQKQLVAACPYGQIYWNDELNIPQKCTFCAHILDNKNLDSGSQTPACVTQCPTDAILFGEEADMLPMIQKLKAVPLNPELGTKPRVYYTDLPNLKFVTGTVVDRVYDENIMGATVTLTDQLGNMQQTTTDRFGDFWFEQLPANKTYTVTISAPGKPTKTLTVSTADDKNLGDIAMN